uniref:GIY-YIG domain-containing protein n=1 Tax=viral metagenome TaxID=1070528 RepID=A0A6M3ITA9_9ZZZZ
MYYLVYKITNNVNGKIYIGVHKTKDRDDEYLGSGKIIIQAIKKYGIEHFIKEILYECSSSKDMYNREAKIVNKEFISRCDTYNVIVGGTGGWKKHTEESKRKIGKANSRHQKGSRNSHYGRCWVYSLEEKRSISIKKEELDEYLEKGWIKGRVVKNYKVCPICKVGRLKRLNAKYCSIKCSGESRIVDRLSIEDLKKLIKMYK